MRAEVSDHTKCISSNKESRLARTTLIDLNSNELHYFQFLISLDRYSGSSNTVDGFSSSFCVTNKTEDVNLNAFNMIKINEPKQLKNHISSDCKCEFDGRKCNSNQKWNEGLCWCECKNSIKYYACKKDWNVWKKNVWDPTTYACEITKHLKSITDDLVMAWSHQILLLIK